MSARPLALAPMGLFDILVRSIWLSWVNLPALVGLGLMVFVDFAALEQGA